MRPPILHKTLPQAPWMDPRLWRLPGILPVEGGDWLRVDEAFAAQMAERDRLIAEVPDRVHALLPEAAEAAAEVLDEVLARLRARPDYHDLGSDMRRPDWVVVPIDRAAPLLTLGRLVQEDLCLLQPGTEGEHLLTGAILCFPASWTLAQKIGRPLTGIHTPVAPYDAEMARRVQRLFDAIRPGQMLWRANALIYDDPTLHQPRREGEHRDRPTERVYLRSERQVLCRLPQTQAVVFSIHTYVLRVADLDPAARAGLGPAGL